MLEPFELWLHEDEDLAERTARDIRSTVWACLCDTEGHPENEIRNAHRRRRYRRRTRSCFERFTRWVLGRG